MGADPREADAVRRVYARTLHIARMQTSTARITALTVYPVKSCRGVALARARITPHGFEHDREWMIVRPDGRFVTQREEPRLALIRPSVAAQELILDAPGASALVVPYAAFHKPAEVVCWRDRCAAFDAGEEAAQWLTTFLGTPLRLVRFDARTKRTSSARWTGGREALLRFADGFPWLIISQGALDDLNSRLPQPLPMNRFRPNIVIDGVAPYAEDEAGTIAADGVVLRVVKPCDRCAITTTDQERGERAGDEPLRTLRSYRFSRELKGVLFGQNLILEAGEGRELHVGQQVTIAARTDSA